MSNSSIDQTMDNVIDFFTRKPLSELSDNKLIRIAPELDGLEMLYSNAENPDKLFSIKVLAWGLRTNGEVVGLVPWLDELVACDEINDPLNGQWQGYYDQGVDELFFTAPLHKVVELRPLLTTMNTSVILNKISFRRCQTLSAPMQCYLKMALKASH